MQAIKGRGRGSREREGKLGCHGDDDGDDSHGSDGDDGDGGEEEGEGGIYEEIKCEEKRPCKFRREGGGEEEEEIDGKLSS